MCCRCYCFDSKRFHLQHPQSTPHLSPNISFLFLVVKETDIFIVKHESRLQSTFFGSRYLSFWDWKMFLTDDIDGISPVAQFFPKNILKMIRRVTRDISQVCVAESTVFIRVLQLGTWRHFPNGIWSVMPSTCLLCV